MIETRINIKREERKERNERQKWIGKQRNKSNQNREETERKKNRERVRRIDFFRYKRNRHTHVRTYVGFISHRKRPSENKRQKYGV